MAQRITVVDAFADRPFAGNPAAVCILDAPAEDVWMRLVAREMNLSETAFLTRRTDAGFGLRWFTPRIEVDLCGHATLASAHLLWEAGELAREEPARFYTKSGLLTVRRLEDGRIAMDFPETPAQPVTAPAGLLASLGVRKALFVGRSAFDYMIEIDSERAVRELAPDMASLGRIQTRGVIVTAAAAEPRFDFVSRFFAPASGIDEDPVTGSAHCCLAPYWAAKLGRTALRAKQVSERGGVLDVTVAGGRVLIAGSAVTAWSGELRVGAGF
jgi:PhzF family phenazine biosynthesis protein